MRINLVLPTVAAVLCSCALALSADDCAFVYIHHSDPIPSDFGKGHTITFPNHVGYHNPSDYWGVDKVRIDSCESGEGLLVTMTARDGTGKYVFNKSIRFKKIVDFVGTLESDKIISTLVNKANSFRLPAKRWVSQNETCGCQVFYPKLRGDKKRYKAST